MEEKSKLTITEQAMLDLVKETYKIIDGHAKDTGAGRSMAIMFLARFAGTVLYRSLTEEPPATVVGKENIAQYTITNFAKTKLLVQEAVSAAFSGAMNTYTGQPIEYYCQVKPVGPALNKEPI